MQPVRMACYSDLLCVWAYIAEHRIDELKKAFGAEIQVDNHFCPVFGDTAGKIAANWGDRGGYQGFNRHLREVAEKFPEIELNKGVWIEARPASSLGIHAVLKAVELADAARLDDAVRALRGAFFRDCRDIADWQVQRDVLSGLGIDADAVQAALQSGQAHALLSADYQDAERLHIQGSPSFVLNEGRQKLYGNVGYRVLEANIRELLRSPMAGEASWC